MMKSTRLFAVLLAVFMLLTIVPTTVFAKVKTYTVTVDDVENGTVELDKEEAEKGETVTVTVTPAEGYRSTDFYIHNALDSEEEVEFEEDMETEGVYTFVMPAFNVTISPNFPKIYTVTVNETENGTVNIDKEEGIAGELVTITTVPDGEFATGKVKVTYTEDEEEAEVTEVSANEYTFEIPEGDAVVSVNFKRPYTVSISEDITDGTAAVDKEKAAEGNKVTITLEPEEGFVTNTVSVTYIEGEDEDAEEIEVKTNRVSSTVYTFVMPESDVLVSATFKEKEDIHAITVASGIKKGKVSVNKKEAREGVKIQIIVEPSENYMLDKLTVLDEDNKEIETSQKNSNTYEFIMADSDVNINASFKELPIYDIHIESVSHGTVKTDLKEAHEGEKVTISISAYSNYALKDITVLDEDNKEVKVSGTSSSQRTFKMPGSDVYIEAVFRKSSSNESGGTGTKTTTGGINTTPSNTNTNTNNNGNVKKDLPFKDVKDDDWFIDDVRYAYENNLMKGITDDTFAPSIDTTRAMIVTILYRIEGEPAVFTANPFTDVVEDAWYANAIKWANGFGIVKGMSDTEFAPDATITREQFAAILYRYAQYKGFDTEEEADISAFEDEAEIQDYAKKPMKWAVAKGFINGITKTSLAPRGNATRAQASAILHRIKNAIK